MSISIVEETLRNQRNSWAEITERVGKIAQKELPAEPPKRIILFGVGSSFYAAKLTAYALTRDKTRPRTPVIACQSLCVGGEVIPARGDWVFAFTHRGRTPVTMQALEFADRAGAFPILVVGKGAPVSEFARFALETVEQERTEPHTASVTGAICAVTSFLQGWRAAEEWDALRSMGDPDLDLIRRRAGEGPLAIIGEWEGEWLAREGALKLMEMARLPARSFGSEEFFHGPKYSVKPGSPIWHVSMPKDPREADLTGDWQPAHRISVFGPSSLAWMPALVELQWLALGVALNLGVDPDGAGK